MNTYDHNQDPLTEMHIEAKWVEHSHAYSHKMGKRVNCCWHISGNSVVNRSYSLLLSLLNRSAVE